MEHDKEKVLLSVQETGVKLLVLEPFYGHLLSGMIKVVVKPEHQRKTAAIESLAMTTVKFSVRSDRWMKLTGEDRMKSFKKQLMHYIFMHPWAEQPSDVGLFYTSCDISANKFANDKESLSIHNWNYLFRQHQVEFDKEDWMDIYNSINKLKAEIKRSSSPKELEFYATQALMGNFWNDDQLIESIFFLPMTSRGSMNLSTVSNMVNEMKDSGASEEEIEEAIKDLAQEVEDPWEDVRNGTSDLGAKEIIKNALSDAKNRGDIPGDLQGYIDAFMSPPKIDWKSEIRKFASLTGNVVIKTTMSRRSKRWGTFPATRIIRTQRIAIIADSSGSVPDSSFVNFFNELRGILQQNCEIIFIQADAVVDQVDIYNKTLPTDLTVNRMGYGGTAFGPALEFVKTQGRDNENFKPIGKVDGVIYMTDGYAPAPDYSCYPKGIKMMWLTTGKPVDHMIKEGFLGNIVYLDEDGD